MNFTIRTRFAFFALFLMAVLAACVVQNVNEQETDMPPTSTASPSPTLHPPELPDLGPAPEISNDVWINSDEPLTLASQRGKVVLVEFWTFG